jgi:transcriptional regulator with XRE-family HTH domain
MNLRAARRQKDITQSQLAELSGVNQTTISDIERGANRNPSWETVARIAKALGVPPEELFPVADEASASADQAVNS